MFVNPLHAQAHELLKSGQIETAIERYTEALHASPGHPDILSDRGVAHLHMKNQKACFDDLNLALEIQPEYAFRYASRAYAKNFFGDLDGAIEDYQIAVQLDPDDAIAHNNLGLLLEQKGYFRESKERFERADKLSKMENELLQVIDDLEAEGNAAPVTEVSPLSDEANTESQTIPPSPSGEALKILTSRAQFREFIRFVRNGFKLK
jgi:tetratricopeptide (TPR) repeat protein